MPRHEGLAAAQSNKSSPASAVRGCGSIASRSPPRSGARLREWDYWGRPVPNFGEPPARLLIVGLAPAAHGANRTGRMFTGDRSGEWLYRALHKAGFANQPTAEHRDDGLALIDCAITAVCHCARRTTSRCRRRSPTAGEWLIESIDLVQPRVLLALGQIAWRAVLGRSPPPRLARGPLAEIRPRRNGAAGRAAAGSSARIIPASRTRSPAS